MLGGIRCLCTDPLPLRWVELGPSWDNACRLHGAEGSKKVRVGRTIAVATGRRHMGGGRLSMAKRVGMGFFQKYLVACGRR